MNIKTKRLISALLTVLLTLSFCSAFMTIGVSAADLVDLTGDATITLGMKSTGSWREEFPAGSEEVLRDGEEDGDYNNCLKFYYSLSTMTFAYETAQEFQTFEVYALGGNQVQDGSNANYSRFDVEYSDDGVTYTSAGSMSTDTNGWQWFKLELDAPITAKYIKISGKFDYTLSNFYGQACVGEARLMGIKAKEPSVTPDKFVNVASEATITLKRDGNGAGVSGAESLLTDGVTEGNYNTALQNFATYANTYGVVFSFDEVKSFWEFKVSALGGIGIQDGSAVRTKTVNIYASTADTAPVGVANWGEAIATIEYDGTNSWQTFVATLDEGVNAKHLCFSFVYQDGSSWAYSRIVEIEAYEGIVTPPVEKPEEFENIASQSTVTVKVDGNGSGTVRDKALLIDGEADINQGWNIALGNWAVYAKSGIVLSFDSVKSFWEFRTYAYGGNTVPSAGAVPVSTVAVYATTADTAPSALADWGDPVAEIAYNGTNGWQWFEAALNAPVEAKHLRFRFLNEVGSNYDYSCTYIQEIETYTGVEEAPAADDIVVLGYQLKDMADADKFAVRFSAEIYSTTDYDAVGFEIKELSTDRTFEINPCTTVYKSLYYNGGVDPNAPEKDGVDQDGR